MFIYILGYSFIDEYKLFIFISLKLEKLPLPLTRMSMSWGAYIHAMIMYENFWVYGDKFSLIRQGITCVVIIGIK